MNTHFSPLRPIRAQLSVVLLLGFASLACGQGTTSNLPTHSFDPIQIQSSLNPDLDIVYHTLAHFGAPGDPSNLHTKDYMDQIHQAKKDLEVGQTKLDEFQAALEASYRKLHSLRFTNLA